MNKELKEQAHKEFNEKFVIKSNAGTDLLRYTDANLIKSFINTLIDKTVQMERERVFEIIKKEKLTWANQSIGYKAVESVEMALSEITNKSDINK